MGKQYVKPMAGYWYWRARQMYLDIEAGKTVDEISERFFLKKKTVRVIFRKYLEQRTDEKDERSKIFD